MKLAQLIRTNHWLSVQLMLLKLYPKETKSINSYRRVYKKLLEMKAVQRDTEINVVQHSSKPGKEEIVDIYGTSSNLSGSEITVALALEFVPWPEWLGMTIKKKTLTNFSEPEIIAHCLFEMTFFGFDENDIQAEFAAIKKSAQELKHMTREELRSKTILLDDLLDYLDSKNEEE